MLRFSRRISGATGVQGTVDSSFTLIEDRRGSGKAKLSCTGDVGVMDSVEPVEENMEQDNIA